MNDKSHKLHHLRCVQRLIDWSGEGTRVDVLCQSHIFVVVIVFTFWKNCDIIVWTVVITCSSNVEKKTERVRESLDLWRAGFTHEMSRDVCREIQTKTM